MDILVQVLLLAFGMSWSTPTQIIPTVTPPVALVEPCATTPCVYWD